MIRKAVKALFRMFRAKEKDIDALVSLRLEMLREVNSLPPDHKFDESFIGGIREYFLKGDQSTYLVEDGEIVGCASICYFSLMPTYDHPAGKRAQIMNVYVKEPFRKMGYGTTLMNLLIDEAKNRGVTEIRLDSTESGRKLYKAAGFRQTEEGMVLDINALLRRNIERAERLGCKPHSCDCK